MLFFPHTPFSLSHIRIFTKSRQQKSFPAETEKLPIYKYVNSPLFQYNFLCIDNINALQTIERFAFTNQLTIQVVNLHILVIGS